MIQPISRLLRGSACHISAATFLMLATMLFSSSCRQTAKVKETANRNDSINKITLPDPVAIPSAEAANINRACEEWFDSTLLLHNFNGGVLVAKHGTIIYEKYFGTGHIGGTDTIKDNTPTHIASVSKTFTAMAVLKLVQEGKVKLDDELSTYFPTFNYAGVTVRCLLNHRSGLPNYLYFMDELGWDKKTFMTNQDVFNYLVKFKTSFRNIVKPCTHFTYCNTNYALLALLIEKASGMSYPQYIKHNFFDPLQMTSSFVFTLADTSRINPSYDWRAGIIPLNALDAVYGDKNIYSTPRDLLKWDRLLSTNLIFKPETYQQAYAPYSNEKPGIRNYGLGWRMNIYPDGKKVIYHNGWWHGNNASFIRLTDEDVTIIAMGNRFCRGVYKAKNLMALFIPNWKQELDEEATDSTGKQ